MERECCPHPLLGRSSVSSLSSHTSLIPEIEAELDLLREAPVGILREHWKQFFDGEPPRAFGPDLLRRSIAQRLQERAYGGLPKDIARSLDRLVRSYAKPDSPLSAKPTRRIRSGAILHREWKGVSHSVTVHHDQFLYQGKAYSNLSEIARLITGTRWNGPRFFGLRGTLTTSASAPELSKSMPKAARLPGSIKPVADAGVRA
jgi:hypothetical protein